MPKRLLTAGFFAVGAMLIISPTATAQPVPGPEPIPVPSPPQVGGIAGCQGGEVMVNGNCVPNMTPVGDSAETAPEPPLRYSDTHSSTTQSGVPTDLVPNINGYPCTGYWMSVACYAENQDPRAVVVPRSTISGSP